MASARAMVRQWFAGRLAPGRATALFERMRQNRSLRAEFDALAAVEALICGPADETRPLTHLEAERIADLVVGSGMDAAPTPASFARPWRLVVPALGLLIAILLVPMAWKAWFVQPVGGGQIPEELFAPRGVSQPYRSHVFLFCVQGQADQTRLHRLDRSPLMSGEVDFCGLGDELQFALTNLSPDHPYLYVLGLDEHGRRLWYFPTPGSDQSMAVETEALHQLLGESIVLQVNHRPGRLRVMAIFSSQPVGDAEIDRALGVLKVTGLEGPLHLDRADAIVESFTLQLEEAGGAP